MKIARTILFLFGLFFLYINNANAGCSGNRCIGKIDRLYVEPSTVYIGTDGDERQLYCIPTSDVFIKLLPDQPMFREIYDLVRDGKVYNRTMTVRVNTDNTPCRVLYVVMEN